MVSCHGDSLYRVSDPSSSPSFDDQPAVGHARNLCVLSDVIYQYGRKRKDEAVPVVKFGPLTQLISGTGSRLLACSGQGHFV